jgi:tRNA pseudouridine13 synthase
MKFLEVEKNIGIETFFTRAGGVGGKLRTIPEDFIVEEISKYPPSSENGRYTIARVTDKNWETNHLVRELSNVLHVSRKRISFAGTKDKRALKSRLMSFYKISRDKLSSINIKDVKIEDIYSSDYAVKIGGLLGNKFEIKVRDIFRDVSKKDIKSTASLIELHGGFPNFYGIQRFGIIRPITHVVGKHIVNADFKEAAMSYIANPMKGEDEDIYRLRERLQKTYDFSEALSSYPDTLSFEKAILNKLVVDPEDFVNALKELPKNLLTMFIYAYQSYLFNRILSERIKRKLPLTKSPTTALFRGSFLLIRSLRILLKRYD